MKNLKLWSFLSLVGLSFFYPLTLVNAQSTIEIVEKESGELAQTSAELSDRLVRECRCMNSSRLMYEIADAAVDLEILAQARGSKQEAIQKFKNIVRKSIELRQFAKNIPTAKLRIAVYRSVYPAVNVIGSRLIANWLPVTKTTTQAVAVEQTIYDEYGNPQKVYETRTREVTLSDEDFANQNLEKLLEYAKSEFGVEEGR